MDSSGETMTQDYVMLNNRLIPRSEASISIDDTGFLYGF
ncbi:MAG TPA: aminodeoxychorismate lyase, partial [Spirochaetes bacterium]|nr:aminodeoxychorismate lyase [Spirochaetota bacterium]